MARVALVHGFTQTPASWRAVRAALERDGHEVVTPALPGHGGTPAVDLAAAADRLVEEVGEAAWVGYSMGGRLCLQLALRRPSAVSRLVLLGATAGLDDPGERTRRRHGDELLATRLESLGVAAFVDEWLAQPMFAGLPDDPEERASRAAANTAEGLAGALRLAGTGAQEPLWSQVPELGVLGIPVLLLAGELDGKFKALARRLYAALVWPAGPLAVAPIRTVLGGATGPQLVPVLQDTGRAQLVFGVVLAAVLWIF